jgi:hypothetical protein
MPRESEVEELMREVDQLTRDINRWLGISDRRRALDQRIARKKKKRKLSAWNKFVKANSKKPRFRYRNGKLNLKKMAIAFRKTPAGRKKRR